MNSVGKVSYDRVSYSNNRTMFFEVADYWFDVLALKEWFTFWSRRFSITL